MFRGNRVSGSATPTSELLYHQYRLQVEQYVKQNENEWLFSGHCEMKASLTLTALGVELALADLYENVDFGSESADAEPNDGEEEN